MNGFTKTIELNYSEDLHKWVAHATADGFDYRGEYKNSAIEALVKAESAMNRHEAMKENDA